MCNYVKVTGSSVRESLAFLILFKSAVSPGELTGGGVDPRCSSSAMRLAREKGSDLALVIKHWI